MAFHHIQSIHGYGLGVYTGHERRTAQAVVKARGGCYPQADPETFDTLRFLRWERRDEPKRHPDKTAWVDIQSFVCAVFTDGSREVRMTPRQAAQSKLVGVQDARRAVKALLDRVSTPQQRAVIAKRLQRQVRFTAQAHDRADRDSDRINCLANMVDFKVPVWLAKVWCSPWGSVKVLAGGTMVVVGTYAAIRGVTGAATQKAVDAVERAATGVHKRVSR